MTSRYHTPDETIEWLTGNARRMTREIDELRAELAARKQGCSCCWYPKLGLMPSPECPTHGADRTTRRGGAQSAGAEPTPARLDPLRHVAVGDLDLTPSSPERHCGQTRRLADLGPVWCTRSPHPDRWQHIAGDGEQILAVWTDDATVTAR